MHIRFSRVCWESEVESSLGHQPFPTAHPKINLGVRRWCVLVEPDRQSEPLVYGCLVGRVVVNQRCAEVAEAVDDVRDLVGG
jgi:hypothetical protein